MFLSKCFKKLCMFVINLHEDLSLLSYHLHDGFVYLNKHHKALTTTVEGKCKEICM